MNDEDTPLPQNSIFKRICNKVRHLALAVPTVLTSCKEETDPNLAPKLLAELTNKQGEVVTLTTISGVLGVVLVILACCLALALYTSEQKKAECEEK